MPDTAIDRYFETTYGLTAYTLLDDWQYRQFATTLSDPTCVLRRTTGDPADRWVLRVYEIGDCRAVLTTRGDDIHHGLLEGDPGIRKDPNIDDPPLSDLLAPLREAADAIDGDTRVLLTRSPQ